MKKDRRLT